MTSEHVDRIESELGITVPAPYRALVSAYPEELSGDAETGELLGGADDVIALNRELRGDGFYGMPWPTSLFAIGTDGGGNYYALDLAFGTGEVIFCDHDGCEFTAAASSLGVWWPTIAARYREA